MEVVGYNVTFSDSVGGVFRYSMFVVPVFE